MEIYRIRPEALPRKLYRIDHHDTWSKFLPGTGFQAATLDPNHSSSSSSSSTTTTTFQSASDLNAFWQCMRDQPNPRSGIRSPFVALFSNRRQAKTWALRWEVKHQQACDVVEISGMTLLKLDVPVFHPHTLRFRIPDLCNTQESEYLCLHSVPETAIVSRRSTSTIPTVTVQHYPLHPLRPRPPRPNTPPNPAPLPSDPALRPLFDFGDYSSLDEAEDEEGEDEEDETINDTLIQRLRNRLSMHQIPGSDGGFYNSE